MVRLFAAALPGPNNSGAEQQDVNVTIQSGDVNADLCKNQNAGFPDNNNQNVMVTFIIFSICEFGAG